jgi:hypothetical protein
MIWRTDSGEYCVTYGERSFIDEILGFGFIDVVGFDGGDDDDDDDDGDEVFDEYG